MSLSREDETRYTFYSKAWLDQFKLTRYTVLNLFMHSSFFEEPLGEEPVLSEPDRLVFPRLQYTVITDPKHTLPTGEAPFFIILKSSTPLHQSAQQEVLRAYYVSGPSSMSSSLITHQIPQGTIFPLNDLNMILSRNLKMAMTSFNQALTSIDKLRRMEMSAKAAKEQVDGGLTDNTANTQKGGDISNNTTGSASTPVQPTQSDAHGEGMNDDSDSVDWGDDNDNDNDEDGDGDNDHTDTEKSHSTSTNDPTTDPTQQHHPHTDTDPHHDGTNTNQQMKQRMKNLAELEEAKKMLFEQLEPLVKALPSRRPKVNEGLLESTLEYFDLDAFF